jgi:hypothetical protein
VAFRLRGLIVAMVAKTSKDVSWRRARLNGSV